VGLVLRQLSAARHADWDHYVRRAPDGTFCHLSGWSRAVEQTWCHDSASLYAERDGDMVGVLPLFLVRSRLFGTMLVSTPNAVYGGPLADDPDARRALVIEAKRLAVHADAGYLELRESGDVPSEQEDADLHRKDLYITFDHPIVADDEALMHSFPSKLRNMIRKGWKHGLRVEFGGGELLDEFYSVYATSLRNLGTPAFPKRLFAAFLRELPGACDIEIVRYGPRAVGAAMSVSFRDTVAPYFAGALREFYYTSVSTTMFWELMRRAARHGYTRFDFGRSKLGSGSHAFKCGWGMREVPLPYRYFLVRATDMPNLNPTNPKYKLLIRLWKRLPVRLSTLAGPPIVKYIP
jgi:FemAB-related protein (PEP-CTERM system-associated)